MDDDQNFITSGSLTSILTSSFEAQTIISKLSYEELEGFLGIKNSELSYEDLRNKVLANAIDQIVNGNLQITETLKTFIK
ncbi:hypothetical protein ACFX5K_03710 [Rickettsiales bacterium LUAb2]